MGGGGVEEVGGGGGVRGVGEGKREEEERCEKRVGRVRGEGGGSEMGGCVW